MKYSKSLRRSLLFIVLFSTSLILGCSSTRATLKFDSLKYPASMSAFLYDQNNKPVMKGKHLKSIHPFQLKKTFWAIGYGLIPLSSEGALSDSLNSLVEQYNGDGILNMSIIIDQGVVNKIYAAFLFVPSLIPIFPSSADITITGEIVQLLQTDSSFNYENLNDVYISKVEIKKHIEGKFNAFY